VSFNKPGRGPWPRDAEFRIVAARFDAGRLVRTGTVGGMQRLD